MIVMAAVIRSQATTPGYYPGRNFTSDNPPFSGVPVLYLPGHYLLLINTGKTRIRNDATTLTRSTAVK